MRRLFFILLVVLAGCRASRHAVSETSMTGNDTTSVINRVSLSHAGLCEIDLCLDSPAILLLTPEGTPGAVITARRATAAMHREDTVKVEAATKVEASSRRQFQHAGSVESHAETTPFPLGVIVIAVITVLILYNVWRRR